jgi:hypothetical protein
MAGITLDQAKDEALAILKEVASDLWDGEEDKDFLKDVALDLAKLRIKKLNARNDAAKEQIKHELKFTEAAIHQKQAQKMLRLNKLGQAVLPKLISIAVRIVAQMS